MDWHNIKLETIIGGKDANDCSFLQQFLIDYKKEFSVEKVNPSCQTCLKEYHNEFIKKHYKMENNSKYELHKKREGLPLEFGSNIFVTNQNLTDEYAFKLIERFSEINENFKLEDLFSKYPNIDNIDVVTEIIKPTFKKKNKQ